MNILKTLPKRLSAILSHNKVRYLLLCLLPVVVVGSLYLLNNYFLIRTVTLLTKDKGTVSGLYALHNTNLLFLDENEASEIIRKQNPYVKTVNIKKQYPSTVIVQIILLKPAAYLQSAEGFFEIGENGRILGKIRGKTTKTPLITYYQQFPYRNYQAGSYIENKDILVSLFFLHELKNVGMVIKTIDIAGFHMLGLYTEEQKFIFNVEKNRTMQSYEATQVIKQLKRQKKDFKTLDVRFDKPVITM